MTLASRLRLWSTVTLVAAATTACAAGEEPDSAEATAPLTSSAAIPDPTNLKPGGHLLRCSVASAELLFAEADDDSYVLVLRELASHGHTLGILLDSSIDPEFTETSTGTYFELTAHLPKTVPNPPAGPFPVCELSATANDLVQCALGSLLEHPSLTDGVSSKSLDEQQLFFTTAERTKTTVQGSNDDLLVRFTLYGAQHPFPSGYKVETPFQRGSCTSR